MSELDRVLDASLREMVGGEGPPDLRRMVLARIGEAPRRPRVAWAALAAAAGIAVAVAGVALLRTVPGRESGASAAASPALTRPAAPASDARVAAASPHRPAPAPASAPAPVRPPARATRPIEAPPLGESFVGVDVDSGVDVEPIGLSPLDVVPMSGEPIAVIALRIERMQIEPLAEPQP
jgi:hypothetical protein